MVWAVVMLAVAVLLKGVDRSLFVGVLMVLIVGAAGTDALLVRVLPRSDRLVRVPARHTESAGLSSRSRARFGSWFKVRMCA